MFDVSVCRGIGDFGVSVVRRPGGDIGARRRY
jgi:hypothetical protein